MLFKVVIKHYVSLYKHKSEIIIEAPGHFFGISEIRESLEGLYKTTLPETHPLARHCRHRTGFHHTFTITAIYPDAKLENGKFI